MGFWSSVKNFLFGAGDDSGNGGKYFYVQLYDVPHRPSPQDEIVEIRIHTQHDLSLTDSGNYFVRKVVVGPRKFKRGELRLYFDSRKNLIDQEVSGGELVTKDDYDAYIAETSPSIEVEEE